MAAFTEIQRQAGAWKATNFPNQPSHQPVLGICEEIGELAEAYLAGDMEKVADALGDIAIYALNLCNNEGTDFLAQITDGEQRFRVGEITVEESPERMLLRAAGRAGQIAHAYLKREQRIRQNEDHSRNLGLAWGDLWVHLALFADRFDMHLPAVMRETWGRVMARDWIAFPASGEVEVP